MGFCECMYKSPRMRLLWIGIAVVVYVLCKLCKMAEHSRQSKTSDFMRDFKFTYNFSIPRHRVEINESWESSYEQMRQDFRKRLEKFITKNWTGISINETRPEFREWNRTYWKVFFTTEANNTSKKNLFLPPYTYMRKTAQKIKEENLQLSPPRINGTRKRRSLG